MTQPLDKVAVVATLLALLLFDFGKDDFDAIDGGEDEGDGVASDRHSVAKPTHQSFGRVGQRLEPGKSEKSTGPLDGMDEAKNVPEDFAVVRLVLEADDFRVDPLKVLVGLGEELPQQVVHTRASPTQNFAAWRSIPSASCTQARARPAGGTPDAQTGVCW